MRLKNPKWKLKLKAKVYHLEEQQEFELNQRKEVFEMGKKLIQSKLDEQKLLNEGLKEENRRLSETHSGLERPKTPDDQNPNEIEPEMQEGHDKGRRKPRNRGKTNWEKIMAAKRRKGEQEDRKIGDQSNSDNFAKEEDRVD